MSSEEYCSDIENAAEEALCLVIPEKSKLKYDLAYNKFCEWMASKNATNISEKVLLAYFTDKLKILKSSTLWCEYSKLRATINLYRKEDIGKYCSLLAFLKRKNVGYVAKQSKIFTKSDIDRFLLEADDNQFLLFKTVMIIGIAGACRKDELVKLTTDDVNDFGDFIRINIKDTKTHVPKQFVVTAGSVNNLNLLTVVRRYISLRSERTLHDRFFVGYRTGKCIIQPVGVNTFAAIPKKIAEYLGLPDTAAYTGHCFRRSSATLLADSGASFNTIKRHGKWKSTSVVERYLEDSVSNKCIVAGRIFGESTSANARFCTSSQQIRITETSVGTDMVVQESSGPSTSSNATFASPLPLPFIATKTLAGGSSSSIIACPIDQSTAADTVVLPTSATTLDKMVGRVLPSPVGTASSNIQDSTFQNCTFNFYTNP